MAPVVSVSQYFEESKSSKHHNRSGPDQLRGKYSRRCGQQISKGSRLESVRSTCSKGVQKMGNTRCRSYGHSFITESANVLCMEQRRPRSLGSGFSGSRHRLELFQSSVLLPSFPFAGPSSSQSKGPEGGQDDIDSSVVAYQALLQHSDEYDPGLQEVQVREEHGGGHVHRSTSPGREALPLGRLFDYWESRPEHTGLSKTAQELVSASWRNRTELTYSSAWRKWCGYCNEQGICPTSPVLNNVLDYLGFLFDQGLKYRTINCARSALSSTLTPINGFKVGQHPVVTRLMKGVFNSRPPIASVCGAWSVCQVLALLKQWSPSASLDLKCLTLKTVMLLALASPKRCNSLGLLTIKQDFFEISESYVKFQPDGLEKHSRPGLVATPLRIDALTDDPRIDPVHYVKAYLKRTKLIRKSESFFVTHKSPHGSASVTTIARWLAQVISQSGQKGTGGSVRSGSSSYALARGASLEAVLEAGDWSRVSTFKKFYYKPVPLTYMKHVLS